MKYETITIKELFIISVMCCGHRVISSHDNMTLHSQTVSCQSTSEKTHILIHQNVNILKRTEALNRQKHVCQWEKKMCYSFWIVLIFLPHLPTAFFLLQFSQTLLYFSESRTTNLVRQKEQKRFCRVSNNSLLVLVLQNMTYSMRHKIIHLVRFIVYLQEFSKFPNK